LVQTDYRWLPTADSNAAFGHNFEGALQEYVLFDQRVITAPDGQSMLIRAPEDLSASAIALCEPWACVEHAYAERQRTTLRDDGQALLVYGAAVSAEIAHLPGKPRDVTIAAAEDIAALPDAAYDDVIYFGADPTTVEQLFPKVAARGLFNIVQCGGKFEREVVSQVGRIHYGGIRLIGTAGTDPAEAMAAIPAVVEIRPNDRINVIGAAGPMGTMHVIRAICQGVPGVTVCAGDLSDERMEVLRRVAEPLAREKGVNVQVYNPSVADAGEEFDYIVVMVPSPAIIAAAVQHTAARAIINIFAGITADKTAEIDLDTYIARQCYFVGTSGSLLEDMKTVLARVTAGHLDTNLSVAAVSGLGGAIDGLRAVEGNLLTGKIIVYPSCRDLRLTPISELSLDLPLENGRWGKRAEEALLLRFEEP